MSGVVAVVAYFGVRIRMKQLLGLFMLVFCLALPISSIADPQISVISIQSVSYRGNSFLSANDLAPLSRRLLRTEYSESEVGEVAKAILSKYRDVGFFHTEISSETKRSANGERLELVFRISEGERASVSDVRFVGEVPAELKKYHNDFVERVVGKAPAKDFLKLEEHSLIVALRKEGYLRARIELLTMEHENGANVVLRYSVNLGSPVRIFFVGNSVLSEDDLLKPLEIETRLTPFGPWVVPNLGNDLRVIYEEKGYFFADIKVVDLGSQAGRQTYQIVIDEGSQFVLKSIRLHGNKHFRAKSLKKLMKTQEIGKWTFWPIWRPRLISRRVAEDLVTIEDYYIANGFPEVKANFSIHADRESGEIVLDINIDEGNPLRISSIDISWQGEKLPDSVVREKVVRSAGEISVGTLWISDTVERVRRLLEDSIKSFGYPGARVQVRGDESNGRLIYLIIPGQNVRIGKILCRGNSITQDEVLFRKLYFRSGQHWNDELIEKSVQRLYESGLFRSVVIEPTDKKFDSEVEDALINVVERDPASMKLGLLYNTEDGVQIEAEKKQRNWRGSGQSISAGINGIIKTKFLDSGRAGVTYRVPEIFDGEEELQLDTYGLFGSRLYKGFSYDRVGVALGLRSPFLGRIKSYFGTDQYRERVFDTTSDIAFGNDDYGLREYGKIRFELEYDGRDNALLTTMGSRCDMLASFASRYFGSEVDVGEVVSECAHWRPVGSSFSLAFRARIGHLFPVGPTNVAPLSSRYFLGGRDTLRGFSPGAVGPRSSEGRIAGGDTELVGNTELGYLIRENVSILSFMDIGQSFLVRSEGFIGENRNLRDLRYSPGLGLRYLTPVGPLTVEYGMAINPEHGERSGRFFAGIGGAF